MLNQNLDLVDPGGVQRRVDKAEAIPVLLVEPCPASFASLAVHIEVVPDDVYPATLVALREGVHEGQQRTRITVPNDATEHLARADVEGREQRARAATAVLELVADDATAARVDGVTARQRLHRLLVDAHDDGVLGRVPVQAADPRDFRSKVGIGGVEPVPDTMRAPATGPEDAPDGTAAHTLAVTLEQGVCDGLVGPNIAKHHAVVRRSLTRQLDDLATGLQRHARRPAAPRRVKQGLDARGGLPTGSPLAHDAIAASDLRGDPRRALPVAESHDDPRADHDVVLGVPPPRERLHARPFAPRDANSSRSRTRLHAPSIHEADRSFP